MDREEALKIVRENYPHFGTTEPWLDLEKALATLIPELRESEDERIRKKLIQLVNKESGWQQEFPSQGQCLAWLEKQKEQKPADDTAFEKWLDDWYQGSKELGGDVVMSESEFKNWSRGIRNMYQQKPSEWSEEDREMIDHLIEALPMWANGRIAMLPSQADEYVERLKSLCPQPKQEWSEEDEQLLGFIYDLIADSLWNSKYAMSRDECLDRLTSLRQHLQPRPSWKPSEEDEEPLSIF